MTTVNEIAQLFYNRDRAISSYVFEESLTCHSQRLSDKQAQWIISQARKQRIDVRYGSSFGLFSGAYLNADNLVTCFTVEQMSNRSILIKYSTYIHLSESMSEYPQFYVKG